MMQVPVIVVMGVSGCGKSTLGKAVADRLGLPFLEGDDFHPPANRERMASGIALTDADRWPWLDLLGKAMAAAAEGRGGVVCSCSALRRCYREYLEQRCGRPLLFLHLHASRDLLRRRIESRAGHYMPVSLLDSQLAALELPGADERCLTLPAEQALGPLVEQACSLICDGHVRG
jgi:carbohydrate kinase (thermoresistant glucokinase family)